MIGKMNRLLLSFILASALISYGCGWDSNPSSNSTVNPSAETPSGNSFDRYLNAVTPPADGFDFPFGDPDGKGSYTDKATGKSYKGWYIATRFGERYSMGIHTGEDWNGSGG